MSAGMSFTVVFAVQFLLLTFSFCNEYIYKLTDSN